MAELDIEKLKRRREDRQAEGRLGTWLPWDELEAIIAALEDRDRLRKQLLEWGWHKENCFLPALSTQCSCGWAEFRAALEGRDG